MQGQYFQHFDVHDQRKVKEKEKNGLVRGRLGWSQGATVVVLRHICSRSFTHTTTTPNNRYLRTGDASQKIDYIQADSMYKFNHEHKYVRENSAWRCGPPLAGRLHTKIVHYYGTW